MRPATVTQPKRELLIREAQERSIIQRREQSVDIAGEVFIYRNGELVKYLRPIKGNIDR